MLIVNPPYPVEFSPPEAEDSYDNLLSAIKPQSPSQVYAFSPSGKMREALAIAIRKPVATQAKSGIDTMASSPLMPQTANDKGGIDFRALPIVTRAAGSPLIQGQSLDMSQIRPGTVPAIPLAKLDEEWAQIRKMLDAGITPSCERMKEYLASCYQKQDVGEDMDKVLSCMADILRQEEESVAPTDASLQEFLVLLESDKPADEFRVSLNKLVAAPEGIKL